MQIKHKEIVRLLTENALPMVHARNAANRERNLATIKVIWPDKSEKPAEWWYNAS